MILPLKKWYRQIDKTSENGADRKKSNGTTKKS
jgi:hypothetical protein